MSKFKFDSFFHFIIYIIGLLLIVKIIFVPILGPIKAATNLSFYQENLYEKLLEKSNSLIEIAMQEDEDEDRLELAELIFKYITDIDISNPQTYIASQIPLLGIIDIGSIVGSSDDPYVIVNPSEEEKPSEDNPEPNENPPLPPDEPYVPPGNIDPNKPLILIYHSHTTEIYDPVKKYSTDLSLGMGVVRVGDALERELETKYGISTIHDTTIHNYPSHSDAYNKSRPTLQSYLKKYPSLKLVIDLHRDGGPKASAVTAVINNEKYARVMFVIGKKNKNFAANTALSTKLNATFEKYYKGFVKPITYKPAGKYNQDLSPNCVLLEVGSENSSLQEALNSVKLIGKVLSENVK